MISRSGVSRRWNNGCLKGVRIDMLTATLYGVRGSTPCSCDETRIYGGNTSCVVVEIDGEAPIILDLGTGLRYYGRDWISRFPLDEGHRFAGTALVSHLHWDHIQGTPFFRPLLQAGSSLEIVAPCQPGSAVEEAFTSFIKPPVFPVPLQDLAGTFTYRDSRDEVFSLGSAKVSSFAVEHVGPTNGYRIDMGSASIAYVSDHQQPMDGGHDVPASLVEVCEGVDILIHDAQFDRAEFAQHPDWGHCTAEYALAVAEQCDAKRLVLFHHDPGHDDAWVRETVDRVTKLAGGSIEVIGAEEGMVLVSGT